jgi:hypothetical protein
LPVLLLAAANRELSMSGDTQFRRASTETSRKLGVNLFLVLFSIYALTSSGNTTDVTDDGMLRYAVTESLVRQSSFALPDEMGRHWGVRGLDGGFYTHHGVGQSLVAIPFYCVGSWAGNPKFVISLMGPMLCASVCVVLFALLLRLGYSNTIASALGLLTGLCTQVWPESKSPFDHHLEALGVLICVYQMVSFLEDRRRRRLWLAGVAMGFAAVTRVTTVLWLLPLILFFVAASGHQRRWRERGQEVIGNACWFGFGFLPFVAGLFWYNAFRFGSIFEAGYTLWAADRHFVNFSNPVWIGLAGELLSPGKGLFVYCPILILAVLGLRQFWASHRVLASACVVASIIYLLFFAKYKAWHGDNAWGPRYFTFLIPFWMLWVAEFLRGFRDWTRVRQIAVCGIIATSFLFQLAAVMVDMNLHYQTLLVEGVIHNVETYAYPRKIYFDVEYSPLLDRFREIPQALAWRSPQTSVSAMFPRLDFWWLQSSLIGSHGWILMCPFLLEGILSGCRIRTLLKACDCP